MEIDSKNLKKNNRVSTKYLALMILGIIFVSFNLRAPITSVGPIIALIKKEYLLNNSMAGFVTTLPLIAFAIFSPYVPKLSFKFGDGLTMLGGLILIFIGEIIRSYTNSFGLFLGTTLIGLGIAIGNVLLPSIIKYNFSKHIGIIISIYITSMCSFAAIGSGLSVPLVTKLSFTWRNSLGIWIILILIAIGIWIPQLRKKEIFNNNSTNKQLKSNSIWKSPLAWWVTLFMGTQSFLFYSLVAWLPAIIVSKNMTFEFSGSMLLFYQLVSLPTTLIVPIVAAKFKSQKLISIIILSFYLLGMTLLFFAKTKFLIMLSLLFMGLSAGGGISLAILFLSFRTPNAKKAAELSGMAQSAGYLIASIGPILIGFLFDLTNSWNSTMIILIIAILFLIFCGIKAGKDEVTYA